MNRGIGIAVKATEELPEFKFATLAGAIAQATSGRAVAGLIETTVGSGYHHTAMIFGVGKAFAGAAVASLGWGVALANSGFVTNAVSGGVTVGRFLETCSSGDLVAVAVDAMNTSPILA
jgi:hypothetical protein